MAKKTPNPMARQAPPYDREQAFRHAIGAVHAKSLAAVLARYPEAEDIGFRSDPDSFNPHKKALPKDLSARQIYLIKCLDSYRKAVELDICTYNKYRDRGLGALTMYDVCGAASGNALMALNTSLYLKRNHISYGLTMMRKLHLELAATNAQLGLPDQVDSF